MSGPTILDWQQIDPKENFVFKPLVRNAGGASKIPLNVLNPESNRVERELVFQAPRMRIAFMDERDNNGRTSVKLSLQPSSVKYDVADGKFFGDEKQLAFFNFMTGLDEFNVNYMIDYQKELPKQRSEDSVRDSCYKNVSTGPKVLDGQYSPLITVKLMMRGDNVGTQFFSSEDRKEMPFDIDQMRGVDVVPLLKVTGIWLAGAGSYGMSVQMIQAVVFPRKDFVGCAIDLGDDEPVDACAVNLNLPDSGPTKKRLKTEDK